MSEKIKKPKPEIGYADYAQIDVSAFYREAETLLRFPNSIKTYEKMAKHPAIGTALSAANVIASHVPIYIEPYDKTKVNMDKAKFLEENLNDMEHSFYDFLREVMSMNTFGFCVNEKVFRYRRRKKGSKFNDGRIGIKKLPIRGQNTVEKFEKSKDTRDIVSVRQKLPVLSNLKRQKSSVVIPRDRFLHFRVNPKNDTPYGVSPLYDVYELWRTITKLEENELIATSKNLNGVAVMRLPSEILDDDADDETVEVRETLKKGLTNIAAGEQACIMLPSDKYEQEEGGGNQYDFNVVSASSSHITSIGAVIERYKNDIYQALMADILQMDNGKGGGSSDLTANKSKMLYLFVETKIKEILEVLNRDLIPDLWRRNGWDDTKCPKICYGRLDRITPDALGKVIQQLKATKLIPLTVENINYIMELFGFPTRLPDDMTLEELREILDVESKEQSRSGDSYNTESGGMNGTSNKVNERDNNAANRSKK